MLPADAPRPRPRPRPAGARPTPPAPGASARPAPPLVSAAPRSAGPRPATPQPAAARPVPRAVPAGTAAPAAAAPAAAVPVAAGDPSGVVVVGGERIRVPGLAAFLRRHPRAAQRGAVGAIVGGVALFVVAAITTPLAAADVAKAPAPTAAPSLAPPLEPTYSVDPVAPAVTKVLQAKPAHVVTPAPVTHGVISGLAANGIPSVALNAYRVAAARMASVQPSCGIDWALLAGIGREESDHGRFGGAVLHADGVSTPRIIGPALDGVHWDYIPAPGNGLALDGDAKYAHALGPMQFIPSTWAIYGADANGDGKADVFNINDAALGTARYLCAAGGDLRTRAGQARAVLAYNHSDQYLAQVLALADAYRRGVPITGLPVGITSGALPTVTDTGYIPPANPGAPTAVQKPRPKPAAPRSSAGPKPGTGSTTRPRPGTSSSSAPRAGGSSTGAPAGGGGSTTSAPPAGGGTSTAPPAGTPTPTPSPSSTCNPLQIALHLCT